MRTGDIYIHAHAHADVQLSYIHSTMDMAFYQNSSIMQIWLDHAPHFVPCPEGSKEVWL